MKLPFLVRLPLRLSQGAGKFSEEEREKYIRFFLGFQQPDGGFRGRRGASDLYYTGFALRALALLGALSDPVLCERISDYLVKSLENTLEFPIPEGMSFQTVDRITLLMNCGLLEFFSGIDVFASRNVDKYDWSRKYFQKVQADDGGYYSSNRTRHSSLYHTFLVYCCLELLDSWSLNGEKFLGKSGQIEKVFRLIQNRARKDGGFAELDLLKHSGTNPTTAALGLLDILRPWMKEEEREKWDVLVNHAVGYLLAQECEGGGFRANSRIEIADLLSTFTVLSILTEWESFRAENGMVVRTRRFLEQLKISTEDSNGFSGGLWDRETDVEFTFYGLALELLL